LKRGVQAIGQRWGTSQWDGLGLLLLIAINITAWCNLNDCKT